MRGRLIVISLIAPPPDLSPPRPLRPLLHKGKKKSSPQLRIGRPTSSSRRSPLVERLPMAALAAAAAENPAPAHDAAVTAAGFRRTASRARSASMTSSNATDPPPLMGAQRNAGTDSIAQASDAHDARIARYSFSVKSGSLTTSAGCENACAGCSRSLRSKVSSLFRSKSPHLSSVFAVVRP